MTAAALALTMVSPARPQETFPSAAITGPAKT